MWYVYIIRSITNPEQRYIGMAEDFDARLKKHNEGGSIHTSKYRPWKLDVIIGLPTREKAAAFENYLKSGSGFAFARKRF